jgi:1-deoxy-D-xylulose-5-phosphate synthase
MEAIPIGTGRKLRNGDELAILTIGHIGNYAVEVCEKLEKKNIRVAHFDMRFVKPIDEQLLHEVFSKYKKIMTVEDGVVQGGFGSAVLEFMADHHYAAEVKRLGIPDEVIEHGEQVELHRECHFDPEHIEKAVMQMLAAAIKHA